MQRFSKIIILLIFITYYPLFIIHSKGQDAEVITIVDSQLTNYPQTVNTIIKTNPFAMLWGPIPFTAEYRVMIELTSSRNQSDQVGISYLGKSPILKLFEDTIQDLNLLIVRGVRFQGAHKFYFSKPGVPGLYSSDYAPYGFYLSPHISYSSAKFSTKFANSRDVFIKASHFNVNFLAGYQLIFDILAIDVFAGIGYKKNIWIEHDQQNTIKIDTDDFWKYYNSPVKLNFGLNAGIVF